MKLPPHTPIIVGIGFQQEKSQDPLECSEPYQLMVGAVRRAAEDAGSPKYTALDHSPKVLS